MLYYTPTKRIFCCAAKASPSSRDTRRFSARSVLLPTSATITSSPRSCRTSSIHLPACVRTSVEQICSMRGHQMHSSMRTLDVCKYEDTRRIVVCTRYVVLSRHYILTIYILIYIYTALYILSLHTRRLHAPTLLLKNTEIYMPTMM